MSGWEELDRELDCWAEAGEPASFWWRDDDATAPSDALATLLDLAGETGIACALAIVPVPAGEALVAALKPYPMAVPVQHGYAHRNHAPAGSKAAELGPYRPQDAMLAELAEGRRHLGRLFGKRLLPILVPPWNRIDPDLLPRLPASGYRLLSTFGPRQTAEPVPGLRQVNAHLDIIGWRRGRRFVGEAKALAGVVEHLEARRRGGADKAEPTGLLTHHLAHDADCWIFVAELLRRTRAHSGARWLHPAALLAPATETLPA